MSTNMPSDHLIMEISLESLRDRLDDDPAFVNAKSGGWGGRSLLMGAIFRGLVDKAALLLERGADLDAVDASNKTAIQYAIEAGQVDMVSVLLASGAAVNEGLLGVAARRGNLDIVKMLMGRMGRQAVLWRDEKQRTPLHYASQKGHVKVVEALLLEGAVEVIDARDQQGKTALYRACEEARFEVVKLLLHWVADSFVRDDEGRTAAEVMRSLGNHDCLELLEGYGAARLRGYSVYKLWRIEDDFEVITKAPTRAKARCNEEAERARRDAAPVHLKRRMDGGGKDLPRVTANGRTRPGEEGEVAMAVLEHVVSGGVRDGPLVVLRGMLVVEPPEEEVQEVVPMVLEQEAVEVIVID